MPTSSKQFLCGAALLSAITLSQAQVASPVPAAPASPAIAAPTGATAGKIGDASSMMLVQAASAPAAPTPAAAVAPAPGTETEPAFDANAVGVREFQGDDVGQVLRLLARQSKINMVVSDQIPPATTVTMRLEGVTALEAIAIIVKAKGLFMDKIENVYYVKTAAERTAEPTESDSFQFSYSRAKDTAPLVAAQLQSKDAPQVDERTNTMFYRETRSNIDNIRKLLTQIDKPTRQVMIEARLVEVTANPKQNFGIDWTGTFSNKTVGYGPNTGSTFQVPSSNNNLIGNFGNLLAGQFAILSVPQFSATLNAINQDADAEFLANPRVVTADNQQAKIEIIRNQPVPQLNFNEQTATAVFGGFQDKKFGNTLVVRPSVNKDNFVTLMVKPEISNKIGDQAFDFAGAHVTSPIIDTRTLDSNVLIKSGDTLAIGGLLQDETTKSRTKVPLLGDIPGLGYFFQNRSNERVKRNLLVFVTPTILDQHYGTGLEDQVSGLHHSGEEFAEPNGWRNNAKGAIRILPTSNRQNVADYPKPGTPPAPARDGNKVRFMADAKDREF